VTDDPKRQPENEDGERVVVRDRRRIDPETGAVQASDGDSLAEQPTGAGPAAAAESGDARVAELTAEIAERTADLQRLSAEYANYRRRVDRDREAVLVNARAQFVGELLTVLDDIERAGSHGDLHGPFKSVADKLVSVVQKLGLEPFGSEGEPFDPSVHEAVQHESSDVTGPTVTVLSAVMRRGYRIGDRVLRPAMVGVVDRADDGTTTETPPTGIPVVDTDTDES
jgi:molecular chaperone GrpE